MTSGEYYKEFTVYIANTLKVSGSGLESGNVFCAG